MPFKISERDRDDRAQLHTLEGITASILLVGILLYIVQSGSLASPQTGLTTDMKLSQLTGDTLICLDNLNETNSSVLQAAIVGWNGSQATPASVTPPGDASIKALDQQIASYFPSDVAYNLELYYYDGTDDHLFTVITHGMPPDNSAVATRLVTINLGDGVSAFWAGHNRYPQVVQARLISWYI